jgi:D-citramalate synthase/methanogen homocitrate synthase
MVQTYGKYTVDSWKPVVGKFIFTRESGGVVSQFHMPEAIEPYSSEILGADRHVALGKKAGLANIKIKLEELGLDSPQEKHAGILDKVKTLGTAEKRLVTDDEFRAIVAEVG